METYEIPFCSSVGPHGGHCIDTPGAHLAAGEHYAFGLGGNKVAWSDIDQLIAEVAAAEAAKDSR